MNLQNRNRLIDFKNELMIANGKGEGVRHQHAYIAIFEMDNPQGLTVYHRKLFNVMWQPGWEESLGENGYMYMYG